MRAIFFLSIAVVCSSGCGDDSATDDAGSSGSEDGPAAQSGTEPRSDAATDDDESERISCVELLDNLQQLESDPVSSFPSECDPLLARPLLQSFIESGDPGAGSALMHWACESSTSSADIKRLITDAANHSCSDLKKHSESWFTTKALSYVEDEDRALWQICVVRTNSELLCEPSVSGDHLKFFYTWMPTDPDIRQLDLSWSLENAEEASGSELPTEAYRGDDTLFFVPKDPSKPMRVVMEAIPTDDSDAGIGEPLQCDAVLDAIPELDGLSFCDI